MIDKFILYCIENLENPIKGWDPEIQPETSWALGLVNRLASLNLLFFQFQYFSAPLFSSLMMTFSRAARFFYSPAFFFTRSIRSTQSANPPFLLPILIVSSSRILQKIDTESGKQLMSFCAHLSLSLAANLFLDSLSSLA